MTLLSGVPGGPSPRLAKLRDWQPDAVEGRLPVLFNVRESDEKNRSLFANMVDQSYVPYRDDPWIAALLAVGLAPLDAEDTFAVQVASREGVQRVEVSVTRIRRGSSTIVYFRTGPYGHAWAMSSAAKENAEGDNDFTQMLIERVKSLRPQVLVVQAISRLARSVGEGSLVVSAVVKSVDQVWVGGYNLMEMTGPNASYGKQALSRQVEFAANERDSIVSRTLAGRVGRARAGAWPFGKSAVPFGYELEPRSRRLVAVAGVRERVREMLLALGEDSAPSVIIDQLAALQVPARRPRSSQLLAYQTQARDNPRAVVDGLLSWAPVWVNGEYLYRWACPYPGLVEFNGAPVVSIPDDRDNGEIQVLLHVEVPEGGWAEDAVLRRVAEMAKLRSAAQVASDSLVAERPLHASIEAQSVDPDLLRAVQGAHRKGERRAQAGPRKRGTPKVAPFSGFSWWDEGAHYELKVAKNGYEVVRRARTHEPEASGGKTW